MNIQIGLISEEIEKIKNTFDENNSALNSKDEQVKLRIAERVLQYIERIYYYLKQMPESDIKSKLSLEINEFSEQSKKYFEDFDPTLLVPTKALLDTLSESISVTKKDAQTKEELIEQYNAKLLVHREGLRNYNKNYKKYKEGSIPYETCLESYKIYSESYLELISIYNSIGDFSMTKPKKPSKLTKTIEDLKLKDFLDNLEKYNSLLSVCEDEYLDFADVAQKYDMGAISEEDYSIAETRYYEVYLAAKKAYEDLQKEYKEIENCFSESTDYIVATDEELKIFETERIEYEKEVAIYRKKLAELEDLRLQVENGLISNEEYERQYQLVIQFSETLKEKNKYLTSKRNTIYNSTVLTRLKQQKNIIKEHLKITTLSEEEKIRLTELLKQMTLKEEEIEEFKSKITVIKISKVKRAPRVTTSKPKPKKKDVEIEGPSEFFSLGAIGNAPKPDPKPIKVVKRTPWEWIKDHKKQILIAIGIAALAAATIVLITQLLPALVASAQATQSAGILSQMITNGQMWHVATAAEQVALHGANTGLASSVTALTGMSNAYNAATGVWTIGGQVLPAAAQAAAAKAVAAKGVVAALSNTVLGAGLGGLGLLGTGLLIPNRSEQYKNLNKKIKDFKANFNTKEANTEITAEELVKEIESEPGLSDEERYTLLRKVRRLLKSVKKHNSEKEQVFIETVENEALNLDEAEEKSRQL